MRQSSAYTTRPSHGGALAAASQQSNASLTAKLIEKKKELDALSALERASDEYVRRMEALSKDCETMADSGKVLGDVLSQWPNMFRILNLYVSGRSNPESNPEDPHDQATQGGERLVRVPLESLLQQEGEEDPKT